MKFLHASPSFLKPLPATARSVSAHKGMPRARKAAKKRWEPQDQAPRPNSAQSGATTTPLPVTTPPPLTSAFPSNLFHLTRSGALEAFTPNLPATRFLSSRSIRCLTYNTYSASPSYTTRQSISLLRVIRSTRADLIVLQEVSETLEALLHREAWARDYVMSTTRGFSEAAGKGNGGGGKAGGEEAVLVMVKKDLMEMGSRCEFERLEVGPAEGGKALVELRLMNASGNEQLRLVTSHFSSLPQNAHIRRTQLSLALSFLTTSPATSSLLLGDFNNASESELELLSPFLTDSYTPPSSSTDLFRDSPTYGELYPFFYGGRGAKRKPRRIDRCYYGGSASVRGYELVGREQVRDAGGKRIWDREGAEGRVWPSDHLGVVVTVRL
ncbi:hypothetical protein P7C70_g623, partial [Phenoliferia sp. Uapishka_3]